jgi:hypothetical protein
MPASEQLLITIHGVNAGPWQENVRQVFEAHFDYRPLRYRRYQRLTGALEVVCGTWPGRLLAVGAFLLACALAAWYWYWHWRINWHLVELAVGAAVVLLIVGLVCLSRRERRRAVEEIRAQLEHAVAGSGPPHIIAHSFGGYLAGWALWNYVYFRFKRVVLVGAALPRDYDWQSLLAGRQAAVQAVRNEHGLRDHVIRLAGLAQRVAPDMGDAGHKGFRGGPAVVHHGASPVEACPQCLGLASATRVHNVPLGAYAHRTALLGLLHAHKLWLPFLWGYTPAEFDEWLELCWDAARLAREERWVDLDSTLLTLASREWTWCGGRRLEVYLLENIEQAARRAGASSPSGAQLKQAVDTALHRVCERVDDAHRESWQGGVRNLTLIRSLHPPIAIVSVVGTVV